MGDQAVSDKVDFLREVPGFDRLEPVDLERLAASVGEASFSGGEALMRRGDVGDAMHVLVAGEVQVPVLDASERVCMTARLRVGDVVGEMALLTGERRRADVIAEGEVRTLVFERELLVPALEKHPPLARFLTEILGRRLEEAGGMQHVGKYRLLRKIGQGSTARVYEAVHPELGRTVAVKMLGHELVYDADFKERFWAEARTIAALNHPNIVQVFDTEQAYATFFLVMEHLPGRDLKQYMAEQGPLDGDETMAILRQISAALAHAHAQGIVHRDVKPSNASIDEAGEVKLMDFGIAQRIRKDDGERSDVIEGTPRYLAPETIQGKPADHRADIYSLAVMAFEMVTGRALFPAPNFEAMVMAHVFEDPPDVRDTCPDLPRGLVRFIEGGLVKEREERLGDWDKIQALLGGGEAGAQLPVQRLEERVIRLRYRPEHRAKVDRALGALRHAVTPLNQADMASATFDRPADAGAALEGVDTERGALGSWLFRRRRARGEESDEPH